MKKQITLTVVIALAASAIFMSGCKKSSSPAPTPAPVFTNDAAFLAGSYSVHDSSITAPHTVINYNVTITASTTTNGDFTINNFANSGTSVNVACTYTSPNVITVSIGAAISEGRTLGPSGATVLSSTAPVKLSIDYTSNAGNSAYENLATFTE